MAKVWNNIEFQPHEKRVIADAWNKLVDAADRAGTSGAYALRDALKLETTGQSSIPMLAAKALLCEWFAQTREGALARDMFALRPAAVIIKTMAATLKFQDRVTKADQDAFVIAGMAKDNALSRMRERAYAARN